MTITTIYEAEDGTQFLSEEACREYEERARQPFQKVLNAAHIIKEFCSNYKECDDCPFMVADGSCVFENRFPGKWNV